MEERTSASANEDLKPLYARSLLSSFGSGAAGPFMDVYALKLGASASDMGWFESIINFSPNVFQLPWGKLSDKVGRRVPFLVVGSLVSSILWIPMLFVASARQLILLMAVQAIIGSMVIPAWAALIGEVVSASTRGMAASSINLWATVGSLFSTLLSGYIMITIVETTKQIFLIPFLIAAVCGIVASFMPLFIKERKSSRKEVGGSVIFGIFDVVKQMKYAPDFSRYCLVSALFGFFMSISWPLLSITRVRILGLSMFEIALLSVTTSLVTTVLQPWFGRLLDRVGRKPLMTISRAMLILVPIFYAFSPNFYYLLFLHGITGLSQAFGTAALFAYLLDVAPEKHRGSFAALYNLVNGSALFAGSLLSGYLSDYLAVFFGTVLSMQIVYAVSAFGRGFGALAFTTLREPYKYPSTLKEELRKPFRRIRKRIDEYAKNFSRS
jgi:MFS family permease